MKIFQIPRGTKRWSLSLVKLSLFQLFWRWTWPVTFTLNWAKSLEQLFLGTLLLKYFAGGYCLLVWLVLLSCEINLTLERVVFSEVFSEAWDQNTLHCLSKKGYYSIVRIVSVRYVQAEDCNTRLHETWVPDNLVLFLYHCGIYILKLHYKEIGKSILQHKRMMVKKIMKI